MQSTGDWAKLAAYELAKKRRKRLFRLWLAISILWIAVTAWVTYRTVIVPRNLSAEASACFKARQNNPTLGKPLDCFPDRSLLHFEHLISRRTIAREYIVLAFVPIFAVLVMGVATGWILLRFNRARN